VTSQAKGKTTSSKVKLAVRQKADIEESTSVTKENLVETPEQTKENKESNDQHIEVEKITAPEPEVKKIKTPLKNQKIIMKKKPLN